MEGTYKGPLSLYPTPFVLIPAGDMTSSILRSGECASSRWGMPR